MENALWNGQPLIASEIAKEYFSEKEIRKASGNKELRCPDSDCQHPVLRYCHGEIKDAYFAHLNNTCCDYAEFDKCNIQIVRTIKRIIYNHFKENGYQVQLEVKVIDHHYTHLLFETTDGGKIAVEIGTRQLSANRLNNLTTEYKNNDIDVKWIVICDTESFVRENQTYFIKRYLLNESVNKDLIVINRDGSKIAQYKSDSKIYEYNGRKIESTNYPATYSEYATLASLTFEGNELSIEGFNQRYNEWLTKKQNAYDKKIAQLEERRKFLEQAHIQSQQNSNIYKNKDQDDKISSIKVLSYEKRKCEILSSLEQVQTPVRDSSGVRWLKCEICGSVNTEDYFNDYGGLGRATRGVCNDCKGNR